MNKDIKAYNDAQSTEDRKICNLLSREISLNLPKAENKIWHAHPVWFLEGNPIAGYSKLKDSVRIDRPADSTKVNNVVRILLNNSLGTRFINYDTTNTSNGAYRTDSLFRKSFRGLSIKASGGGNVLTYFDLTNSARTKLTVYYKLIHSNGRKEIYPLF